MQKLMVFVIFLAVSVTGVCQPGNTTISPIKIDYLKKSKNQKRTALILLGGGVICTATGMLLINTGKEMQESTGSIWGIPTYSTYHKNDGISAAFGMTGILSMLTSIPIFLASHRNKKKAMRLTFKTETAPQLQKSSFVNRPVPSFALRISL